MITFLLVRVLIYVIVGAILGLIPFFLGRYLGKPNWGKMGLICCALSGLLHPALSSLLVIVFSVVCFVAKTDIWIAGSSGGAGASGRVGGGSVPPQSAPSVWTLRCTSGPLRGQSYRIGANGLTIGRENDCTVRFPNNTSGISRHHCCLRWQGNNLCLLDLGSSYGTFMADGRQLIQNNPITVSPGSQFYLGSSRIMFQIVVS